MELTATVPSLLGNLSFLVSLDLSNNGFHGNLPEDLAGMPRLRVINLFNNSFSGFFPTSFTNISKLEILIIAENNLHGNIPQQIGNLTNLKQFYGEVNRFSGGIPSGIGSLRMLEYLYLGDNLLQGSIPEEISNLDNLHGIGLFKNNLSGSIPFGIFNISSLQIIVMTENYLSGTLPSSMGQTLPNLEYLFLYQNHISGKIPDSISNSSKLKQISLELNKFTGPIPNSLGNLKFLECLHLFGNQLTNVAADDQDQDQELSFLTSLTNCRFLQDISVSGNPLSGFLPTSIGNFSFSLTRVYANRCMIKGKIPDEIGNLTYINILYLSDNDLSGSLPTTVTGLRRLQGLLLGNNKIGGSLPDNLCGMPQLSTLNLIQNQISGQIPDCLGNVTSLRNLHLASNRLDSTIPLSLWNLNDLLELDLSSNSLTGNLPLEIQNLQVATYINLSINGFTGVIPDDAYGNMQNLISFSLASNNLHGSIPQSFSGMISLVSLDLSNNNLSGEIPMELEGLKFLTYFNVSFNKLSGEIPRKGPFKNFSYMMFESNEALCSDDPELRVPRCPDISSSSSAHKQIIVIVLSVGMGSLVVLAIIVIAFAWKKKRNRGKETLKEGNSSLIDSKEMERFSYQQLKQATDDFSHGNLLGSGSFGSVYRATFKDGTVLAVKVFDLGQEHASRSFERECEMLSRLRHRNLTKVISACSNVLDFKALILEYMQNGSLEDWLYGCDDDGCLLDFLQRLDVMIDVASALEYLHHGYMKPVIHCDLKPSNVLLDGEMVGRVTDFGITKLVGEEGSVVYTQTLATLGYMAPEFGIKGLVSSACDVYSFGILLMETFTRKRPCDDMFAGELSLRSWINAMLPNSVSLVVDSSLTREEKEDDDDNDEHFTRKMQCVSSIFALAMACTVESPKDRLKMKNVLTALEKIKLHFIATCGSSTTQG
ncbi:hypothetical protein C2S51_003310 [Perilla frutescens var. frutescens]|nr:hypothetical protein C2S51_003310 [Perilla frutescens var. frutescens]